jgi:hypothetical protein
MLTRKLSDTKTGLVAGLILGLTGPAANATDVVVAYGSDTARQAREAEAEFQTRMGEFVRSVDAGIKANVEKEVAKIKLPEIRLALGNDDLKRG